MCARCFSPSAAVAGGNGDQVDLYGYTTMAVATLQVQAREIEALRRELSALRQQLRPAAR